MSKCKVCAARKIVIRDMEVLIDSNQGCSLVNKRPLEISHMGRKKNIVIKSEMQATYS